MEEIFRWEEYEAALMRSFTPANPISLRSSFRGRHAYMRRVMEAVNQTGQHVMVYGERGVGKTSLANVLAAFLEPFTSERIVSSKVNCFRETDFTAIWNSFFDSLDMRQKPSYEQWTPPEVLNAFVGDTRKVILIVDEFDRVEDPDVDAMFADTIKTMSDFAIDTTLVIVGVADDVEDLIAEHASIDRCMRQVNLPRMEMDELGEIVEEGIGAANMTISPEAISQICTLSLGLPHYAHAMGLAAARAAIDKQRADVGPHDVDDAVDSLMRESHQTILASFDAATASPRRENFYFQVLLACALVPTDHRGYFRARDIREPYARIMGRRFEIPSFVGHLHRLCEQRRGAVLHKFGELHNFRFRFADPMLQPFVLMHGLKRGLVGLSDVQPRQT